MATSLDLVFLGTSSAQPSKTRNVSALALRVDSGESVWLFDCGEGTQRQIMMDDNLKLTKVKKIFVTHNHGDHIFGLPGLLLTTSALNGSSAQNMNYQIIGPKGLRLFLRIAFQITYSRMGVTYSVDELILPGDSPSCGEDGKLEFEMMGNDIQLADDGLWHIGHDEAKFEEIIAAPIEHTIPTVGFVLKEVDLPGSLNADIVKPRLLANKDGFIKMGIKNPMSLMSKIKNGETIELPDGSSITPADVIGPPKLGRTIVILGDTSNPSSIIPLLPHGCNVVVHEATNSTVDEDATEEEVEKLTVEHGHSTPQIAGSFAHSIKAKALILNHFSSRYKGDQSEESVEVMNKIRDLAISTFGSGEVYTAFDHFIYSIPKNK